MRKRPTNSGKNNGGRKDITLMTILANEATSPSRKLLLNYGKQDAKNCQDLEEKLADLYFKVDDKIEFEKQLSDIHPHKDWILKTQKGPVVEMDELDVLTQTDTPKKTSLQEVEDIVQCSSCNERMTDDEVLSSFEGQTPKAKFTNLTMLDYIGIIGIIGTIGISYYVITKNK
jgi:hypothetical protein